MGEPPADLKVAAFNVSEEMRGGFTWEPLLAALVAERERCAVLVENFADPRNHPICAAQIAAAIRKGEA